MNANERECKIQDSFSCDIIANIDSGAVLIGALVKNYYLRSFAFIFGLMFLTVRTKDFASAQELTANG